MVLSVYKNVNLQGFCVCSIGGASPFSLRKLSQNGRHFFSSGETRRICVANGSNAGPERAFWQRGDTSSPFWIKYPGFVDSFVLETVF